MNTFYEGPDRMQNFRSALTHWLAIFSEGRPPIVPMLGTVAETLDLPCYADFPASEKANWLRGGAASETVLPQLAAGSDGDAGMKKIYEVSPYGGFEEKWVPEG